MSTELTKPLQSEPEPCIDAAVVIPEGARIPDGATFHEGEDDGKCRVIRPDGRRCGAARIRSLGICSGHAGRGAVANPREAQQRSAAARLRIRERRQLLAIGPRRAADPRAVLRLQATERAEDIAGAMLAPIDDSELGTMARQTAARAILDAAFPLAQVTAEVSMPADAEGVAALSWQDLQALAQALAE